MRSLLAGAVATLAIAAGCTSGHDAPNGPVPAGPTQVVVENHNWLDVTVYAVRSGMRQRLGTVGTAMTGTFRIPPSLIGQGGQVQLLVDPIGASQTRLLPPISIVNGDRIDVAIHNHLPLSSISVLPRGRR